MREVAIVLAYKEGNRTTDWLANQGAAHKTNQGAAHKIILTKIHRLPLYLRRILDEDASR